MALTTGELLEFKLIRLNLWLFYLGGVLQDISRMGLFYLGGLQDISHMGIVAHV